MLSESQCVEPGNPGPLAKLVSMQWDMHEYEHARSRLTGFALTTRAVCYESTRSRYVLFLKIFIRETRLRLSCCSYQPFIHSKEHVQLKQTSLLESRCLARKVCKVVPTLTELRLRSELGRIHLPRLEETEIFSPTSERETRVFVRTQEENDVGSHRSFSKTKTRFQRR